MRHEPEVSEYYLQPGESRLVTHPAILRTVLGSCVGIAFWAPRLGAGALCHPLLPAAPLAASAVSAPEQGRRFVDFAIRELAERFDRLGALRAEIVVKLFGGADVLDFARDSTRPTVGRLNGETALRVLGEGGFGVAASSLGGNTGVSMRFDTGTGEVLLRRLGRGGEGKHEGKRRRT